MIDNSILVVDDDAVIRTAFNNVFSAAGYRVRTAESAERALELMREAPSNLLFIDLNLPGMNGVELGRQVRREWPWSIAIAVTGFPSVFELVKCREAGFDDYFLKPAGPKELKDAARQAFEKMERWTLRPGPAK